MSPQTDTTGDTLLEAQRLIGEMRDSVESGDQHWFHALLHAVRNWPLSGETKGEREFHYLVGGEAFDWLLLAERLCEEMTDLIPENEVEALLFHEKLPLQTGEADFDQAWSSYKAKSSGVTVGTLFGTARVTST